ncbi:MAG: dynamin family protein [Pseudomonadota bacterium]
MNADPRIAQPQEDRPTVNGRLLSTGFAQLTPFLEKMDGLRASLEGIEELGDETTGKGARRLMAQLDTLEPSVTMIGQVKAGKTSLVNAMVGWPELLPADVNPWTSVVTSLHVTPAPVTKTETAVFRFFDQEEWDRLVENGGRIGELASRAGAEEELEKIREQIDRMREKSQSRLGRRFELLLGQAHDYATFDKDLIERYVCLGDDFEDEEDEAADTQGRFADITRSADLTFQREEYPLPFCIRDTPGVNDTFMMREQITIRAIRESRICVVVLSAHQALSSMDLALIRLISNVKSREVIIFVNRVDELSEPAKQIPEIRASITDTLEAHDGPKDAQIIFGSAYWADRALTGRLNSMDEASTAALLNWAETELETRPEVSDPAEMIWELSGVPQLFRALCERVVEGIGAETTVKVARSAANLTAGVRAASHIAAQEGGPRVALGREDLMIELGAIEARSRDALEKSLDDLTKSFHVRMDRSHKSFLDRATANLISHLEKYGEQSVWQYSPAGLRLLLRSAYQVFGAKTQASSREVYETTAGEFTTLSEKLLGGSVDGLAVTAPEPDRIAPPVSLGQTIALDLQGKWWKTWWQRRRGYNAFASGYYELIRSETHPIVEDLKVSHANAVRAAALGTLAGFLAEQREILTGIVDTADQPAEELAQALGIGDADERRETLDCIMRSLSGVAA